MSHQDKVVQPTPARRIPEIPDLAQLHSLMSASGFEPRGIVVREQDHWQWYSMYGTVPVDTCVWTSGRSNASCCLYDGHGHAILGWTYLYHQWVQDSFSYVADWLCGREI